jgi:threonine/homoserine/homoserine lactone efflux protein
MDQLPVDPAKYSAFLIAMFIMAITPGPANLFAISTGLDRSVPKVLMGVLGLNCASLIWFMAAGLGLHILMMTVPLLFRVMTFMGALYLFWIAFTTLKNRRKQPLEASDGSKPPRLSYWQTFRKGFMVQFLNPKVTLFFTAILPPFLDISRPLGLQIPVYAATALAWIPYL